MFTIFKNDTWRMQRTSILRRMNATQRLITSAACFFRSSATRLSLIEKELRRNICRFVSDRHPTARDNKITRLHNHARANGIGSYQSRVQSNYNVIYISCLVIRSVRMVLMTRHGVPRAQQRKSPLLLHSTQDTL